MQGASINRDPLMNPSSEEEEEEINIPRPSEWLECFCVVKFDIEIGQTLEYTFPPTKFTEEETTNICFLSFPDSNSGLSGDVIYTFRTRKSDGTFLFGYTFFRQVKDSSISRGYLQKSVVLLSPHPFIGLFRKIISLAGPFLFEQGETFLEAAYHNMAGWPSPKAGKTFDLPVLGSILTFHVPFTSVPHTIDPSSRNLAFSPRDQVVSNLQSVNVYSVFKTMTNKLWMLWELVLTGEPLLVMSPSPPQCSDAVLGLISLISPLRYCGDYRPYFTIHDSDFKEYTTNVNNNNNKPPSLILGVTNPFFFKALGHWPHILTIGAPSSSKNQQKQKMSTLESMQAKMTRDPVSKLVVDYKQGIQTTYRPLMEQDKKVSKQLLPDNQTTLSQAVNNELLRRHFLRLTETFLVPLERYFTSLMPLARNISVFNRPPRLKTFSEKEFLELLNSLDKRFVCESKNKEIELYQRFLRSVNFRGWFSERRQAAVTQLNILYRKAILEADVSTFSQRTQAELIDLHVRLRDQLNIEESTPRESESENEESKAMISKIKEMLHVVSQYSPVVTQTPGLVTTTSSPISAAS